MKTTKTPDRIASELLETVLELRNHHVLSTQELDEVKAFCSTPPTDTRKFTSEQAPQREERKTNSVD